jgi:hypothetical protein
LNPGTFLIEHLTYLESIVAQMTIGPTLPASQKRSDTKKQFSGVHESLMRVELDIGNIKLKRSKKVKSFRPKRLGTKLFNMLLRWRLHP